jgi:DNA polymerase III delta prime subunit
MEIEHFNIHGEIHKRLDGYYKNNQIPNIIFHGASGTGKKTIVNAFIDKIYNNDRKLIKNNTMFVNCSHGKGIKFIREELKFFAKANLESTENIKFKTIILLNADHLTNDAQSALRRCIELFTYTTRFFMIVENKHKLLNPILSRFCEIYVWEHFIDNKIVNLNQTHLTSIMDIKSLNERKIKFIKETIKQMNDDIINNNNNDNNNTTVILEYCDNIYNNGYSCLDIVEHIKNNNTFNDIEKSTINVLHLKLKSEFRCEKMLLFSVLNFIYNREMNDIHHIKFM